MNIRDWRLSRDLTQLDCAERLGISQATLSKIESGSQIPGRRTAERIEAATNGEVTAAELLGLETPVRQPAVRKDASASEHRATLEVSMPPETLEAARAYELDAASLLLKGGLDAVRAAIARAYYLRNKEAVDAVNAEIREHGTFAEQMGSAWW